MKKKCDFPILFNLFFFFIFSLTVSAYETVSAETAETKKAANSSSPQTSEINDVNKKIITVPWLIFKTSTNADSATTLKFGKPLALFTSKPGFEKRICFIFDKQIVFVTVITANLKYEYKIFERIAYGKPESRECENGYGGQLLQQDLESQQGRFLGIIFPYFFTEQGLSADRVLHIYDIKANQRLGSFAFKDKQLNAKGTNIHQTFLQVGFKWIEKDIIQDDYAFIPDSYALGVTPKITCPPDPNPNPNPNQKPNSNPSSPAITTTTLKTMSVSPVSKKYLKKFIGLSKINLKKQTQVYEKIRCEWQLQE